jgi:hypothetical protein
MRRPKTLTETLPNGPHDTGRRQDVEGSGGGELAIMRTPQARRRLAGMIAPILAASLLLGCTLEQILIGQCYIIYTPPSGACPGLEWQFVVNPERSIGGFLSRDGRQPTANLSGVLNADDSFWITVTEVAGNRTASVTGRFTSQVSTVSIRGGALGSACDGQTFTMRLGAYFASQGGGGGGGG